jgi:TPR repeat protein
MENRNLAIPVVILLVLLALVGISYLVIKPNSIGVPGMLRLFVLKTTHLAFSCGKQADIGEKIFLADEPGLDERADLAREWFTMALSCNSPAAQYYIGDIYLNGYGTRQNVDKGISYLEKSRRAGYSEAARLLASVYRSGEIVPADRERAMSEYEACAGDGKGESHAACAADLAQLLVLDIDPPQYVRAYKLAELAAKSGNALGQSVAAYLLYNGLGVERDAEQARVWAESGAAQGEPFSYGTLVEIYLRGEGVPADKARALKYLEQLEGVDASWADRQLGYIYRDGMGDLPPDPEKSVQYFVRAAERGDRKAAGEVGRNLYESIGTGGNFSEAFRWLTHAADKGDGTATLYLSRLYFAGVPQLGIAPSRDKGWFYLNQADKKGVIAAKADLARLFFEGKVVTRNDKEAFRYAEAGARAGHARSQAWLGFFLQGGIGTDKDEERAVSWLEKAAAQGDSWGEFQLGESLFHGLGVPVDRERARQLFERSFESGNVDAAMYLGYYFEHALVEENGVDLGRAYAYYEFAARRGSDRAAEARRRIEKKISPADRARSQALLEEIEKAGKM